MARFSFGIFGLKTNELQAGLKVYIKNSNGEIVASTESGVYEYNIIDNNDGAYYVDGLPTGVYSVYVNNPNTPQPELQNIVLIDEQDVQHFQNSDIHTEIDDNSASATKTWSGQKISTELSKKADNTTVENLQTEVNDKASAIHTHTASEINIQDSGGNFEASTVEGALSELANLIGNGKYANEEIISNSKTITQNLELLQNKLLQFLTAGGQWSPKRMIYLDIAQNTNPDGTLSLPEYLCNVPDWADILVFPFKKEIGEAKLYLNLEMTHTDDGSHASGEEGVKLLVGNIYATQILGISHFNNNWGSYSLSVNIGNLSTENIYIVRVQLKNPLYFDDTLKARNLILYTG